MSIEGGKRDDELLGPLFDEEKAEAAAEDGIARASSPTHRQIMLEQAQVLAERLAMIRGEITADDVVEACAKEGLDLPKVLGNAMGALFRGGSWELAGYRQSQRVSRHGNVIRVWRLK